MDFTKLKNFILRISFKSYIVSAVLMIALSVSSTYLFVRSDVQPCLAELEMRSHKQFEDDLEAGGVDEVYYSAMRDFMIIRSGESWYKAARPENEEYRDSLLEYDIVLKDQAELVTRESDLSKKRGRLTMVFVIIVTCQLGCLVYKYAKEKESVGLSVDGDSDKKKKSDVPSKTFADVAGLHEVKADLWNIVGFLKDKEKYAEAGAKLPKGVIFYGPPGTGKTLLAKALSGEAGVPFHYASGSDFIEMYVGVGAKRVRELFEKARHKTPCIIFIDEIDAIGGKRTGHDSTGEDRKTINALLTEMDGFKESDNIIVIGATNRLEDLDPALTRPGRFTDKFCVPIPETVSERKEVLSVHIRDKKLAEDMDIESLARETSGFSPAQIEAVMNEAAILSVQRGSAFITKQMFNDAVTKMVLQGHIRESQAERDMDELKIVAWHEAGHAVVGRHFGESVTKVTILSTTSGAGGVTFTEPKRKGLMSVQDLRRQVMQLYGGRAAEELLGVSVTTGASNDIERATEIIHGMAVKYGMDEEFGPINLERAKVDGKVILERESALAKELYGETVDLLRRRKRDLKKVAEALLDRDTVYADELRGMCG